MRTWRDMSQTLRQNAALVSISRQVQRGLQGGPWLWLPVAAGRDFTQSLAQLTANLRVSDTLLGEFKTFQRGLRPRSVTSLVVCHREITV